jgi:hypothetical protein
MLNDCFLFFNLDKEIRCYDIETMSLVVYKEKNPEKNILLGQNGLSISRSTFDLNLRSGMNYIRKRSLYQEGHSVIKHIFTIGNFIFSVTENDLLVVHDLETLHILTIYKPDKLQFSCFSSLGNDQIFLTGSEVSKNIEIWHFQKRNVIQILKRRKLFDLNFKFEDVYLNKKTKPESMKTKKSKVPKSIYIVLPIILVLLAYLLKKIIEIKFY